MAIERLMTGDFIACLPFPHIMSLHLKDDPVRRYWDVMRSLVSLFDNPQILTLPEQSRSRLYSFLRARYPACHATGDVDLRALDRHRGAAP